MMKNNFEQSESRVILDSAYEKALDLDSPEDMDSFANLYKDVSSDLAYVEEMDGVFRSSQANESEIDAMFRKMAKVFEVIMIEQIELSNWLGDTAMTTQASKYDDYKNGVDAKVEFDDESGVTHLALAIDVTTGHQLSDKFGRIKNEIDKGVMTKIKYFTSEALGFRGEKGNIPRVVIGADRKTIYDLMEKWLNKNSKNKDTAREAQVALAEHVVQAIMIEEIVIQLNAFAKYAESVGQTKAADVYQKTLGILLKIKEGKNLPEQMILDANDDEVLQAISANIYSFKK